MDSPDWRGLTVYLVDVDEARALANADPAVRAGWFDVVVDPWWIPAREVTLGNRVDLTLERLGRRGALARPGRGLGALVLVEDQLADPDRLRA